MEEELDVREALATGEHMDELIVRATIDKEFLRDILKYLDDDLWTVQKNALRVVMEALRDTPELHESLITKLMVMLRKSEAVPLTQEIARAFGVMAEVAPKRVSKVVPAVFANYRVGDPKIKVNMAYVLEEIIRVKPSLLGNVFRDIGYMLVSKDSTDKLTALNFISALGENGLRYVTPFLPKLLALLHDRNEIVRASAVETLVHISELNPKLGKIIRSKLEGLDERSDLVMKKIEDGLTRLTILERSS
ncbi:PH0542 domain-containing protein [Thermococcus sp.]|uniref:PH0542 domain-containing protein n=1 Tax=Thermococcus sp. TaxID=35749 RepID=UPI00261C89A4|nr:PH0542 domain-containing protein [Thermococcus sp.]